MFSTNTIHHNLEYLQIFHTWKEARKNGAHNQKPNKLIQADPKMTKMLKVRRQAL